jgi:hypothetical protein
MNNTTIAVSALLFTITLAGCGGGGSQAAAATTQAPNGSSSDSSTYTPAGNAASVVGVDSAGRGYRDDVQQLIQDRFSSDPKVQASAIQVAKDFQDSITSQTQQLPDTTANIRQEAQNFECTAIGMTPSQLSAADVAIKAIYARTFNTDARMGARQNFVSHGAMVGDITPDDSKCSQ